MHIRLVCDAEWKNVTPFLDALKYDERVVLVPSENRGRPRASPTSSPIYDTRKVSVNPTRFFSKDRNKGDGQVCSRGASSSGFPRNVRCVLSYRMRFCGAAGSCSCYTRRDGLSHRPVYHQRANFSSLSIRVHDHIGCVIRFLCIGDCAPSLNDLQTLVKSGLVTFSPCCGGRP